MAVSRTAKYDMCFQVLLLFEYDYQKRLHCGTEEQVKSSLKDTKSREITNLVSPDY
jgi:hypothetical protein